MHVSLEDLVYADLPYIITQDSHVEHTSYLPLQIDYLKEIYMYRKKLVYLALATLLPMGSAALAQEAAVSETVAEQAAVAEEAPAATVTPEGAVEPTVTEPAAAVTPEGAVEPAVTEPAAAPAGYGQMSMEERRMAREQRYEELKKRAEESGVMLPEHPPWHDREAMMKPRPEMQKRMEHRKMMQAMTPEARDAYRMGRYQEMRDRASEMGIELPETPRWKERQAAMDEEWVKHQEVIKGMSDEERAACHAMHRRHMREMGPGQMMRGQGMRPPMQEGPMPGYGYGPAPYGPRSGFWDPYQ